ncbi:MAG: transaldolase [Anaerolineae bacterium]|nr:transaldolase [Anaerolineae bacterium]
MAEIFYKLHEHGQSLWYDNISRDLLQSGEIKALIDAGIRGMTSNPAIFQKAIVEGKTYDEQLQALVAEGKSVQEIYENLAVSDIQAAADLLRPLYDSSKAGDGFVSLEVSPLLADQTQATIDEALRLAEWVDRPNLMIKIPATLEGIPAVEETLAKGLNINVTLIFSLEMYKQVIEAFIKGTKRFADSGGDVSKQASVASFFVSRVDSLVDDLLDEKIAAGSDMETLKGKAAVANAKLAYKLYKETFAASSVWTELEAKGARKQRPLWASTSTKNPDYDDLLYVNTLIGPNTVNTAPPQTIEAFADHGVVEDTVEKGVEDAQTVMDQLAEAGIDMVDVTDQLLDEGVVKFADAFKVLMNAIEKKMAAVAK